MAVDVVVCTYNSEQHLDACLTSIKQNVPYNNIYIIDKYSVDDTRKIALKHGCRLVNPEWRRIFVQFIK